jgi:putative membrane protein
MTLLMLVFWGGLIAATFAFVRLAIDRRPPQPPPPDDARRLLDERFARGEIDAEDYTHRRELLGRR